MDSAESSRGLVDEEGNLLGVVNVVDLLAVGLVLAIGITGAAVVFTGGVAPESPESATTHATLDLGQQPTYIAAAISEGDSYSPTGDSNLSVTGVHLAPAGNGTQVVIGVEVRGVASNGRVRYAGAPLRLGRQLGVNTSTYNATGRVTDFGAESTLATGATTVVVSDRLAAADAEAVSAGDKITVAGRTVGTVTAVDVAPTASGSERAVRTEVELRTYRRGGTPTFGQTAVRPSRALELPTSDYTIDGRVTRVGDGLGRLTNRTVTLSATRVREPVASIVRPRLAERSGGRTTAYVTGVSTEPSPVVATTANGTVVTGDHPTRYDLTLTTELRVRETATGPQFRGERLQYGSTVVLDLGTVTVETTVVGLSA
ncbi:DUF4330 family protein [Haloarcula sediminis]|uniref:DUF4330 family protein n=1 Tax=Haloarcula sediminis TaxID=3111777 RepID=UPI002D77CF66|nr:DUF4330 family protein [Haloarcula sp. CK38]